MNCFEHSSWFFICSRHQATEIRASSLSVNRYEGLWLPVGWPLKGASAYASFAPTQPLVPNQQPSHILLAWRVARSTSTQFPWPNVREWKLWNQYEVLDNCEYDGSYQKSVQQAAGMVMEWCPCENTSECDSHRVTVDTCAHARSREWVKHHTESQCIRLVWSLAKEFLSKRLI